MDEITQSGNSGLNHRPDVKHRDAYRHEHDGTYDGDKPGAAEEGEYLGELGLIEAVVEGGHAQSHDDAAKYAHLQRGDAQSGGGGVGRHGLHAAPGGDHCGNSGIHNQIGDGPGQGGHLFLLLGHTDGHAHGEKKGQVVEYGAAALIHDVQNRIEYAALIDHAGEAVGLQHGLIGERAADAQQQSGYREQSDGQHKGPAHPLQYAKYLILHNEFLLAAVLTENIKTHTEHTGRHWHTSYGFRPLKVTIPLFFVQVDPLEMDRQID